MIKCKKCELGTLEMCQHPKLKRTVWGCDECDNYVDLGNRYDDLKKVYDTLPKVTGNVCQKKCESGECKFECCSITGCSNKEKHLINKYINKFDLDLPYVTCNDSHNNFILPATGMDTKDINKIKCAYIGDKGCKIYEVRPAICRLFGACKQMMCTYFPDQAKEDYPIHKMVEVGFFNQATLEEGGGIDRFKKIINSL